MKTYRDQMHGLQFTPEQKAAMVDALLAASQAPHQRHPQPDVARQLAGRIGGGRDDVRRRGQQEDIVKGQPEHRDLGRIVTAGRHRNRDGNAAFSDRHGWGLQGRHSRGSKNPSYRP